MEAWPKLWQNLRTSAATDFARICPAHVAAKICGHTVQIARAFYWQTTDADIEEARVKAGGLAGGLVNVQSGAVPDSSDEGAKSKESQEKPENP